MPRGWTYFWPGLPLEIHQAVSVWQTYRCMYMYNVTVWMSPQPNSTCCFQGWAGGFYASKLMSAEVPPFFSMMAQAKPNAASVVPIAKSKCDWWLQFPSPSHILFCFLCCNQTLFYPLAYYVIMKNIQLTPLKPYTPESTFWYVELSWAKGPQDPAWIMMAAEETQSSNVCWCLPILMGGPGPTFRFPAFR